MHATTHAARTTLLLSAALFSSAVLAQASKVSDREANVPKCARPVAKVMFTEFKCKSADCSGGGGQQVSASPWWYGWGNGRVAQPRYTGVGQGLSDMLATALSQTGCFEVMERAALDDINKELALVGKKAQVEQADYMITGSITSIGFDQSATNIGAIPFLSKIPLIGSASYKTTNATLNLDLRVVEIEKAKIRGSKTFEGKNQRTGFGLGGTALIPGVGLLGGNHASISGSPLEEVARDVLIHSMHYVVETLAATKVTSRVALQASPDTVQEGKSPSAAQTPNGAAGNAGSTQGAETAR